MVFKNLLIIIAICVTNTYSIYDYNKPQTHQSHLQNDKLSVVFPHYNVEFVPISENEQQPFHYEDRYYNNQEEKISDLVPETDWTTYNTLHKNYQPIYLTETEPYQILEPQNEEQYVVYEPQMDQYYPIFESQTEEHYPIITRNPISIKKTCIKEYFNENPKILNKEYNPLVNKYNSGSWFYTSPNWNNNNAAHTNFVQTADPRSIVASHTHFIKIKKPIFGSKVIFSHNKKIIGHDHDKFVNHLGGDTNIHKNTHIHVHNRNAQPKAEEQIIGSHLFAAPRWRRSLSRKKRGALDIPKLFIDPKTKLDFQKTSENVGAATRNIFEEDYSPVYHLTNALGAAQDTFHSFMNVRPAGVLVPCSYRIVHAKDMPNVATSPIVGGINPAIYDMHNQTPHPPSQEDDSISHSTSQPPSINPGYTSSNANDNQYIDYSSSDPLTIMGDRLRESVQWAQKSAGHAVDIFHHARQMVTSTRKGWPKMLLPYLGAVEVTKPKIGHGEIVGTVKDPEFVGVGSMMDCLGMTDKKIDRSPRVGSARMISEEEVILKKAKEVLGEPTYRNFLNDIKKHLDITSSNDIVGQPRLKPNTDLQTRLALERLRSSLMLQKAKADLKKLQAPKLSKPHFSPIAKPIQPVKPLNSKTPLVKSPTLPTSNKNPTLKSIIQPINPTLKEKLNLPKPNPVSKQSLIQPVEPLKLKIPALNKSPILKQPLIQPLNSPDDKIEILKSPLKVKSSNPTLEKIRAAIEAAKITPVTITTTSKPSTLSPLDKLREKLYEKYNIPTDKDHSDILGKTLSTMKNSETVAAAQNSDNDSVPVPVLTKEMKTPFMGLATKQDLEQYFKKLYCASCKMGDIN